MQAISKLAIPTVIGQIVLVIYNMADTFFVGLTGNDAMLTAVTVCMPLYMILSAVSNLFGVGASSSISRALGRKNTEDAHLVSSISFWGCILTTLLYSLLVFLFGDLLLNMFGGAHPLVHDYSKDYLLVALVFGGLPTTMNAFLAHLLRAEGKALHAGFGVALGGVLNIILDPLFMFLILPDGNEVAGAALATALSNVFSVFYYIIVLYRRRKKTVLRFAPPRVLRADLLRDILSTGLPACIMTVMENLSYALMESLIAAYGLAVQTGLGVAKKVNMLAHCIARGMTQGVLPLIGYNYSAKNFRRMRSALFCSAGLSATVSVMLTVLNLTMGGLFVGLFIHSTSEALDAGTRLLMILCTGGPFSAFAYTVISFFQATGKGVRSFMLALLRKGLLDIPLMFLLNIWLKDSGIVLATPIADILCCTVSVILLFRFLKTLPDTSAATTGSE
ncbi:MAG: MATE family efflux transporter [Clostridia bacterium]|nr:MATE family efflux transporter [Clostridia bacterium]